jgi:glycosyltransferase involved in cell wall biosynthesis
MTTVGVIVIGRNEGERLATCLRSVRKALTACDDGHSIMLVDLVYVDSNSTDDSVATAEAHGAHVVTLDPAVPFTAARARNAGAEALFKRHPETDLLQFLDGDTELHPRWLVHAVGYLRHNPRVAVVCGRRRERRPEASPYNLLADMEWDTPVGQAGEFGGDALIRGSVFLKLGGYTPTFIAGEEPEFSARLRLAGHQIVRLNHEMTLHDLAMMRFSQWWRRTTRSGHALAQLAHTHGGPPLYFYKRAQRSTLLWGLVIPAALLALAVAVNWWLLLLLPLAYAYLTFRVFRYRLARGDDRRSAALYAAFTTVGKFPQLLGMVTYYKNLWLRRQSKLIEYKSAAGPAAGNPAAAAIGNT